jgi:hypothetical protein
MLELWLPLRNRSPRICSTLQKGNLKNMLVWKRTENVPEVALH